MPVIISSSARAIILDFESGKEPSRFGSVMMHSFSSRAVGTGLVLKRQKDRESCSCIWRSRSAFHLNGSAVFTDYFRAYPQSEASAGIALRADKRLEERLPDLRVYPGSCIRDGQTNAGSRSIPVFARVGDPNL